MVQLNIRPAKESEVKTIYDFIAEHFDTGNPMIQAYIYKDPLSKYEVNVLVNFIMEATVKKQVLMAIEESTGTLVGVMTAESIDSNTEVLEPASKANVDRLMAFENILTYISAKANIRQRFNAGEYLHIAIVGVHQNYRQLGIARRLFECAIDMARTRNFKIISVDCTNIYSSKIAEKLGMKCVSSVSYDEYNNHLGKCLFVSVPPNTYIKTFVMQL